MLSACLDADVLVLPEGSPFRDALELMRPALERAAADVGEAAWRAALARLQGCGLYRSVMTAAA